MTAFVAFEFENLRVGAWSALDHGLVSRIEAIIDVNCSAKLGKLAA
jgi:hypothetical protein